MSSSALEPFSTFQDTDQTHSSLQNSQNDRDERTQRSRVFTVLQGFTQSNPPLGMWQATGEISSKIPTLPEIHDGSFTIEGWTYEGQMQRRGNNSCEMQTMTEESRGPTSIKAQPTKDEAAGTKTTPCEDSYEEKGATTYSGSTASHDIYSKASPDVKKTHRVRISQAPVIEEPMTISSSQLTTTGPDATGTYPNGYRFPKKHTWTQSIIIGLQAFWKFVWTPMGFLVTVYGLNVIGWGAMIFFVLLNAAPAMCHPSCDDDDSARKKWIEIDSQILNGLFCVTGFGLIPWRLRDFYYLMMWRIGGNTMYHRKLAGIYRGWYRLPGSNILPNGLPPLVSAHGQKRLASIETAFPYSNEEIAVLENNPALPLPLSSIPDPPLTGIRARPTRSWSLDIVVWMYLVNTAIQGGLAGIMWGLNRFTRPSWATGLLICLGCITGIIAGIVVFLEGSKVKKVEGIPVREYDVLESAQEYQERKAKEDLKGMKKRDRTPEKESKYAWSSTRVEQTGSPGD